VILFIVSSFRMITTAQPHGTAEFFAKICQICTIRAAGRSSSVAS
jgi:hypothetical protein